MRIFVFLILGAIVNVAVAWVLAIIHPTGWVLAYVAAPIGSVSASPRSWLSAERRQDGAYDLVTFDDDLSEGSLPVIAQSADSVGGQFAIRMTISEHLDTPAWCFVKRATKGIDGRQQFDMVEEAARGWPFLSVRCETRSSLRPPAAPCITEGVALALNGRPVPALPIWPGFAINTVFYAFVLWLLFAAPFALRRWRRIKRGLCPKCAYPVGTSDVCTECGARVRQP